MEMPPSAVIHAVAEEGSAEEMRDLIERKADVNAKDADEETPLHIAARKGKEEVARVLTSVFFKIQTSAGDF